MSEQTRGTARANGKSTPTGFPPGPAGILTRSYVAELEIREGRQIAGIAVPYDTQIRVGGYLETFRAGAFKDSDPTKSPLTAMHPTSAEQLPIGVAVELHDEPTGLRGVWHISKTQAGDEVLELVRDGAVSGLSIGFIPDQDRWNKDRTAVERLRALLDHTAIVRVPAYDSARITALRAAQHAQWVRLHLAHLRSQR
jgi:HK97 family phage prohead protease